MITKLCTACGLKKLRSAFSKCVANRDGLQGKCKSCCKEYRLANRERECARSRKYHVDHKEHQNEVRKAYRDANPELRAHYDHVKRMRKKQSMTPLDRKKTVAYRKQLKGKPCFYCGELKDNMVIDHMFPLSRGGTDHWFNLVSACYDCNGSKGAKLASEWRAR